MNAGRGCGCGGASSRPRVIIFVKKRISRPMQPKSVAELNRTIHTIAAGCNPRAANSVALPKITPRPPRIVIPSTMLGTVSFNGARAIGALIAGSVKLAPQRLQYFSSTVISLPQVGQYIGSPVQ